MELQGKSVVVTGGGVGTGRAVCLDFARRGASVAVNYSRSIDEAELTAEDCRAAGVQAFAVRADVKSDDEIRDVIRQRADTVYHPVGSCKMGTDEQAVVDPQLRVHGIEGLRVIDASIMPTLIGGNTNAPAMMIAEKAVDMIRGQSRVG